MNIYLRWLGILLIMLCALLAGRKYSSFADKRLAEYDGFIDLLLHFEREIDRSLSYGEGLYRSFENNALTACGFLPKLREGANPREALISCRDRISLPTEAVEGLLSFFESFGREYKSAELSRLRITREELQEERKAIAPELEKNKKTLSALLLGGALSMVIMLI